MNDRSIPYRCKINPPYNRGQLQFRGKKSVVDVVEQSRESFTVSLPEWLSNKLSSNSKVKLFYQGAEWCVGSKNKWVDADGRHLVELECIEELAQGRGLNGNSFGGSARLQNASAMDGTYAAVFLTVMTVCILIMPAWGGKWGTSQLICNFVGQVWQIFTSIIPGGQNLR